MLGIRRLSASGAGYYLSDLAQELPLGPGRPGTWTGTCAADLGLRGTVEAAQLEAVLRGCHPATGRQMRSPRATVSGFDLTFSAPKSVSVLFALGGPEVARQVQAAHDEGVRQSLAYVERSALAARRGTGEERTVVPTSGVIAASFTHGVSRTLDPHLHTHVVVSNMVHGTDSRWSACDQRGLSAHRHAASAAYDAHMRAELSTRLGLRWDAGPEGRAEVAGIPPLVLGEFSSRAADIRRHMAMWGAHSNRGARVAWAVTRPSKQAGPGFGELTEQWARRARATGVEFDLATVRHAGPLPAARHFDEHRFAGMLSLAADGAARRRDVVAALGTSALEGARVADLERVSDLWIPASPHGVRVGVAERAYPLRSVVPGPYVLRALGPRPCEPDAHAVWRDAATVIESYRERWGVARERDPLGLKGAPTTLSSLPTSRLVDHLQAVRQVDAARRRLGRRPPRAIEMDRGR